MTAHFTPDPAKVAAWHWGNARTLVNLDNRRLRVYCTVAATLLGLSFAVSIVLALLLTKVSLGEESAMLLVLGLFASATVFIVAALSLTQALLTALLRHHLKHIQLSTEVFEASQDAFTVPQHVPSHSSEAEPATTESVDTLRVEWIESAAELIKQGTVAVSQPTQDPEAIESVAVQLDGLVANAKPLCPEEVMNAVADAQNNLAQVQTALSIEDAALKMAKLDAISAHLTSASNVLKLSATTLQIEPAKVALQRAAFAIDQLEGVEMPQKGIFGVGVAAARNEVSEAAKAVARAQSIGG